MKKLLELFYFSIFFLVYTISYAQTNVSGGIFSNTTWTKVNSPYIVTDTVVVFPGVTLTIQPGVVVKFDYHIALEIRQAKLIAIGTLVDSITFTSNLASPYNGIWRNVYLNGGSLVSQFKYCNFRYAGHGIYSQGYFTLSNSDFYYNSYGLRGGSISPVDSCNFRYNVYYGIFGGGTFNYCNISNTQQKGLDGQGVTLNYCVIDSNQIGIYNIDNTNINNCYIRFNQSGLLCGGINGNNVIKNTFVESNTAVGLDILTDENDSVINCQIRYNGTGLKVSGAAQYPVIVTKNIIENNSIGIELTGGGLDSIYCNRICNNALYGLKLIGSANTNCVVGNYWCTSDSASTEAVIYDAFDNVSLGIVYFMPIDSLCAPSNPTYVNEIQDFSFNIFPNPATDILNINIKENKNTVVRIYNLLGGEILNTLISKTSSTMDVSTLTDGIYVLEIISGNAIGRKKFVISKQ